MYEEIQGKTRFSAEFLNKKGTKIDFRDQGSRPFASAFDRFSAEKLDVL
jgi:hypothetical protein